MQYSSVKLPSLIVAPNARMVIITQITERIGFVKKRAVLYINIEDIERDIHCSMNTPTFDFVRKYPNAFM